ncbi:viral innexin-c3.1 [Ichnoviriform fugitivi]|uniref:Viral innexin-c3.1 n=1 Tax=Ichnoviriform fugitivi TaxID=265522 RepID=A2Q0G0_9VIRU|nr:viral innexin-c3.1 [Ichnoviriform fugitivi]BAF45675.1 viral innexin-c3.1 [Ichnoviriform fugitivi]
MLDAFFDSLRGLLALDGTAIDTTFFRLHYKSTVGLLLIFSLLSHSREYFGEPLDCHFTENSLGSLNKYCAVQSTFVIEPSVKAKNSSTTVKDMMHPAPDESREKRYYSYYQWVSVALLIQALFFYAPWYIWETLDKGRMATLIADMAAPILRKDVIIEKTQSLLDYVIMNMHKHNFYAYSYFACELLSLLNVVGHIILMNIFLGEGLQLYGAFVTAFNDRANEDARDPMETVFPSVTKCTFRKYDGSGDLQTFNGFCILTQNSGNAKIYTFLWLWFHLVAVISVITVTYRMAVVFVPSFRLYMFRWSSPLNTSRDIEIVYRELCYGDWFVLRLVGITVNPIIYKTLISELASRLKVGELDA